MDFGSIILDLLFFTKTGFISITGISKKLKENGFSGDYKNTYTKIMQLEKEDLILIKKIGKSNIISLNYANSKTISRLASIELLKKIDFLEKNTSFEKILLELLNIDSDCILMSNPQKNFNLNRIELLALTKNPLITLKKCGIISKKFSIRIDCLALKNNDFLKLLNANNQTILSFFSNKLILTNQEYFFELTSNTFFEKKLIKKEYYLNDLNESELRYNLSKYGYSEFGKEEKTKELCFEEIIISTLLTGTARQKTALTKLLNENEFNPELIIFLSKKYLDQNDVKKIIKNKKLENLLKVIYC